jgi:hypothetical protein
MTTPENFKNDTHGAKYLPELDKNPEAFVRLLAVLNDHDNVQYLTTAAHFDLPALDGVAAELEADPAVAAVAEDGQRFRQAVGVAVRLRMEELGWHKTGIKRRVTQAKYFKTAEVYAQ